MLSVDLRALALMRIGLGVVVLSDAAVRFGDARAHYSDAGLLPRELAGLPPYWGFRLYFASGDERVAAALLLLTAGVAIWYALGYRARLAGVALWLLVGSLHARNGWILQGGDALLLNFLLWTLFLPMSARWSLDARRRREPPPTRVGGPAVAVLYVQLFFLYFVSGTLKANYPHWWWGDGVYYALSADHFVTDLGRWLYPHFYLLKALGWATLALEIAGPFVLVASPPVRPDGKLPRVRTLLVVSFIAFHAGIAALVHVGLFSLVCVVCWLFAVPSAAIDRLEGWARRGGSRPALAGWGPSSPRAAGWVSALLMGYLVIVTMIANRASHHPLTAKLLVPARVARLHHRWGLFGSRRKDSGWMVAAARRADGSELDLLTGQPLRWERPESVLDTFENQRWRKLISSFRKPRARRWLDAYLEWQCREQQSLPATERAQRIEVTYVHHEIGVRYRHGPNVRKVLGTRICAQGPGLRAPDPRP